jgi:glycosyltransferase involved in cell wall biosynthesis
MNVVHVITGLENGGAEASLYRLCSVDRESGWQHTVISLMGRGIYAERLEGVGVSVHSLGMPRGRITAAGTIRLYSLLRSLRPAIVQTWMYHADLLGGVAARLAGVNGIVWSLRGPLNAQKTSRSTRLVARLCAVLSRYVPTRIVSCSVYAARVHQALGYSADKFVIIPNGYPLDRFAPMPDARRVLRADLGAADNLPLLGMVARFDPYKDHFNLIQALGLLKRRSVNFLCVLIGSDVDEANSAIREMLEREDVRDRVKLLGARDDIPELMNALDVHVLSSLDEAFPNVLAEAMACGTPCVTTDVGDARLIIGNTGWTAPPQDATALAEAIQLAISARSDDVSWQMRKVVARVRIEENFGLDRMQRAYRKVWIESAQSGSVANSAN